MHSLVRNFLAAASKSEVLRAVKGMKSCDAETIIEATCCSSWHDLGTYVHYASWSAVAWKMCICRGYFGSHRNRLCRPWKWRLTSTFRSQAASVRNCKLLGRGPVPPRFGGELEAELQEEAGAALEAKAKEQGLRPLHLVHTMFWSVQETPLQ